MNRPGKTFRVLLGVSGSIAAYKAAALTRLIVKQGWQVRVIMTRAATEFVTPLTFQTLSQNPVGTEQFAPATDWHPEHIAYAEDADVALVAPCTANVMAKITHGLADDLLTATLLATHAPLLLAPAMNEGMWRNPATQANIETLIARGAAFISPETGELACGTSGAGRMAEPETILAELQKREEAWRGA